MEQLNASKYKSDLKQGIRVLNSLFLDDKLRYYSTPIKDFFDNDLQITSYINCIAPNKPMDFKTIRYKVTRNKYRSSSEIYHDIVLVFDNARKYNHKGSELYNESLRLHKIFKSLKKQKAIKSSTQFKPAKDIHGLRQCPLCNNILSPSSTANSLLYQCNSCTKTIHGSKIFHCYNHSDAEHFFCKKCVIPFCSSCSKWHSRVQCPMLKPQTKKRKRPHFNDENNGNTNNNTNCTPSLSSLPALPDSLRLPRIIPLPKEPQQKRQKISHNTTTITAIITTSPKPNLDRSRVFDFLKKQDFFQVKPCSINMNELKEMENKWFQGTKNNTDYAMSICTFIIQENTKVLYHKLQESEPSNSYHEDIVNTYVRNGANMTTLIQQKMKELFTFVSDTNQSNDDEEQTSALDWNHEQFMEWVLNIKNGRFKRYKDVFETQEICGFHLNEIEGQDLVEMGITKVLDKKLLCSLIRELLIVS